MDLTERCRHIRCLLLDVDGVLTDGKLHFTSDGQEFKSFDVQDGHGIAMAQRAGLLVGFVSGRPSAATTKRAADLGVTIVAQQPANKMELVEEIKRQHGLENEAIAFVGDELVDLPVLRRVGLAVAVPNAVDEVKAAAHHVTRRAGGNGAVREVIDLLLKAQGRWPQATAKYFALALLAGLALAGVSPAGTNATPAPSGGYIERFEVPERDENGDLRWKVSGDRAQFAADGQMQVTNIRAEFYSSNKVAMVFTSPACLLDQQHKRAATDAPVRLEHDGVIVTGIGGDWQGDTSTVVIRSNVQVVITGKVNDPAGPRNPTP